jgi:BASS family bile acid:Na+ symporter
MDLVIQVVVPAVVVYIMAVVGLSLAPEDFGRVARFPRVVLLATVAQLALLPLVAVGLAILLDPPPFLAAGLIILAVCPPAAMVNFLVDLARANTPLSVTLTAIGNLILPFLLPMLLAVTFRLGLGQAAALDTPIVPMLVQTFATMIVPLAVGMGVRIAWPGVATRAMPALRKGSVVGILMVALLVGYAVRDALVAEAVWVASLVLLFALLTLGLGYGTAALLGLDADDRLTLALDVSLRNGGLAIFVGGTLLGRVETAAIPIGAVVIQTPLLLYLAIRLGRGAEGAT